MDAKDSIPEPTAARPMPVFEREHSITLNGQARRYRARAGWHEIREPKQGKDGEHEGEQVRAKLFAMTYTRLDVDSAARPLLFVVNGWPPLAVLMVMCLDQYTNEQIHFV